MRRIDPKIVSLLVAIATALFVTGLTLTVTSGDETHTVHVGPTLPAPHFDKDNNLSAAQKAAEVKDTKTGITPAGTPPAADAHEDLRDETPPGAPPNAAEKIKDAKPLGTTPKIAPGGAQNYSCPQRLVRNRSPRLARVKLFVLHYTVSPFGSINGIFAQFNNPSSGTSSTLGLELTGQCQQWVPFSQKPWTQLTFNSVAESVEIVAPNDLPTQTWLRSPLFTRGILASIVRDRLRANGLALRFVDPVGCPSGSMQTGWTDHNHLECGNSHTDVGKNFPFKKLQEQISGGNVRRITKDQRARCAELNRIRKYSENHELAKQPRLLKRAQDIKRGETKNGLRCLYPPKPRRLELVRR